MIIRYSRNTKLAAQELRRNMTPQEKRLWYDFLRMYPAQFRRQKQFGRFIVDFYCAAAKLVVEIDGAQHFTEQGKAYDTERTWILNEFGLRVVRFSNHEIDSSFEAVCLMIDAIVTERTTSSGAAAPPSPEGKA